MLWAAEKPAAAEAEYRAALVLGQRLAEENPRHVEYRRDLAAIDGLLAEAVHRARRNRAEALGEPMDRGLALLAQLVKESPAQSEFRSSLDAYLRARRPFRNDVRDPGTAATSARRALSLMSGLPSGSGEQWFETACCHAALAGLAGQNGSGVSAAEAKTDADQAMALLRKAVDAGYRNAADLRTDSALGALRKREDFKKLVEELEKPAPAKPEKKP